MNSGLTLTIKPFAKLAESAQKDPLNASILPILAGVWSVVWNRRGTVTVNDIIESLVEVLQPMPVYDPTVIEFVAAIVNTALPNDDRVDLNEFLRVVHSGGLDVFYLNNVKVPRTLERAYDLIVHTPLFTDALQVRLSSLLSVNLKLHYSGEK